MLDPLTALGLAGNVVQLVDFGFSLVSTANKVAQSGATEEHRHLDVLARETKSLCEELELQSLSAAGPGGSSAEKGMRTLAKEAQNTADEMSTMLKKLMIKDDDVHAQERPAKRRRTAVGRAVIGMWKEKDLERLRKRLGELQGQLLLRMCMLQSASSRGGAIGLIESATEATVQQRLKRLEVYEQFVPTMLGWAQDTNLTNGLKREQQLAVTALLGTLPEVLQTQIICQRILESLSFTEIHNREERIPQAHTKTFSWIFERDDLGFVDWLQQGEGLFWITGKPGAGKSTLMKYIVQAKGTKNLLSQWAGTDQLIVAHHYFWYAGTDMQTSQEGLLRTILFHIVQQSPNAAVELCPDRFVRQNVSAHAISPWTLEELQETLIAFGNNRHNKNGNKICFFVDGLDEYKGEHIDLVNVLNKLAESPAIKICVSSRPWNTFQRAYDGRVTGQLLVQDLTEPDILAFVTDSMMANPLFNDLQRQDPDTCEELISAIVSKAQGVFLWVHLVVRSLIRGLGNDDDGKTLRARLDEYPDTLDAYFHRMLSRVEKVYSVQSARILLNFLHSKRSLRFWTARFFELEIEKPDYAVEINGTLELRPTAGKYIEFYDKATETTHKWLCKPDAARRYIDARCGDLLEVTRDQKLRTDTIQFVHRTARDFLEQNGVVDRLWARAGQDFDPYLSLARVIAAGTKMRHRIGREFEVHDEYPDWCMNEIHRTNPEAWKELAVCLQGHAWKGVRGGSHVNP